MKATLENRNQTFDLQRFYTLFKSDIALNKGTYIKMASGILGVFLFVSLVISLTAKNSLSGIAEGTLVPLFDVDYPNETLVHHEITKFSFVYLFVSYLVASFVLTVLGSVTFSSLSEKKSRISTFMLPASMAEKFWSKFAIHTCLGSLVILVSWLLGFFVAKLTFGAFWTMRPLFGQIEGEQFRMVVKMMTCFILWMYVGNAVFAFGSALWPRLSWLKTWIVLTCIQWIAGILLIVDAFNGYDIGYLFGKCITENNVLWVCLSFMVVVIAGFWAAAWWRFRTSQIVQLFMRK